MLEEFNWMIGGPQGSGVDSSANLFARACGYAGYYVFGKREYYSNIKGEHSYFTVRVSTKLVRSHRDSVDLLATFDPDTLARHAEEVTGGIIYDPTQIGTKLSSIPTLEKRIVKEIVDNLSKEGFEDNLKGLLEYIKNRGVRLFPIPYTEILKDIGREIKEQQLSLLERMKNTLAVAASFALMDFKLENLEKAIREVFKVKAKVAEQNVIAAKKAYQYTKETYGRAFSKKLKEVEKREKRILITGNTAIALGKLVGGYRFQTYYPITPAADESVYLEANEVFDLLSPSQLQENPQIEEMNHLKGSIVVMQSEDEIAAITMAIGAALAGVRASTSTSGPGFSLMMEGLGWAGMNEVPVVITHYQRGGPSTGLPTRHDQSDLRFSIHAGHGEFPKIVYASGDIEECFYDAIRVMNYAERYQVPVIHLVDKALANSTITCPWFNTRSIKIDRGLCLSEKDLEKGEYKRFKFTENGVSPRSFIGQKGGIFWNTGDEHDELGHITEDPVNRKLMMEKRMKKLELAYKEIPKEEKANVFGDSDVWIVSWGSTKGPILDALEILKEEGINLGFFQAKLLHPFPKDYALEVLGEAKKIIDIEMNYSAQFAGLLREHTGLLAKHKIVKYNGRPFSVDEIYFGIKKVLLEGSERVVVNKGA
ncbi:2-oxoglutarate oxidoreductase subunit KorA [archaeon HR06]|nr:2-oxoglutarate oxidoreductase subunit KorA [archaeon HR06]